MAKKISDFTKEAIKRAYLKGEGSYAELAKRFKVGQASVERMAREGDWRSLKEAQNVKAQIATKAAIATIEADTTEFDIDALLLRTIQYVGNQTLGYPVQSADRGGVALAKMIQTYRKYHPLTMAEAVDLIVEIPDFDPLKFAQLIKDRWSARNAS